MQTMNTKTIKRVAAAIAAVAFGALSAQAAEPTITADATTVTVSVPAGYAPGAQLILAAAASDRGTQFGAWATTHELVASVPAAGGAYAATFADLGFPDGNCTVRAFFKSGFEKLDYLIVDAANEYTDVGVLDTDVYGIDLGYKPTGGGKYGKMICAIGEGSAGTCFRFERASGGNNFNFCAENTSGAYQAKSATLDWNAKNTVVAKNSAITVNGKSLATNFRTAPMGLRGARVRLNTMDPNTAVDHSYGWWYYLKIYGADGRTLVDFVPARRTSDNTVGFYDDAEKRFVTPTGGGTFGAGTAVAESAFTDVAAFTPAVEFASRGVTLAINGNVATVTVPAGVATGEKLYLVSDEVDRGLDVQAWHDSAVLAESIPAEGGSYNCTLTTLCTFGDNVLRAFAAEDCTRLASVTANELNDYRDTGVLDTFCYGFEYGYQPINGAGKYGKTFAAVGGTLRFERVNNGNSSKYNYCALKTDRSGQTTMQFTLSGSDCNDIVFRNQTLTHNGTSKGSGATAPVDATGTMLRMNNKGLSNDDRDSGKWYYIRLYARNGAKVVDYVPAKKADGTVGFVDMAGREFVTPSGGGAYTSDNVAQGTVSRIIRYTAATAYASDTTPATAEWVGGADTDLKNPANWLCRNVFGEALAGVMPNRELTDATVSGAFAFSVPTAEDICWRTLKFENAALAGNVDWRGSFSGDLATGFSLDLNGHTLTVDDLQGSGTVTDTTAGGEVRIDVAENATGSNAGVALTGSLKVTKTGAGKYSAMTPVEATYTGGTAIEQGCAAISSKAHPTAGTSSLVVYTNGVFDLNLTSDTDAYIWTRFPITLAGGTLQNTGVDGSTSAQCLGTVELTADSTIYAKKTINFIGSGYSNTCLDLNGHTLSLDAAGGFRFYNTEIKNGTLKLTNGGWVEFRGDNHGRNGVDASTSEIEIGASPRLDIAKPTTVGSLVVRANDTGTTIRGGETIKIVNKLTPYTDYIHNYEMQDGSTLDLSIRDTVYPTVNGAKNQYKVTFAEGATVTVDVHGRAVGRYEAMKVLSWSNAPTGVTFVLDEATKSQLCGLETRADGLYVVRKPGLMIIIQ